MQPELLEMKLISESMALSHGTAHVSCLVCVALARQWTDTGAFVLLFTLYFVFLRYRPAWAASGAQGLLPEHPTSNVLKHFDAGQGPRLTYMWIDDVPRLA